MGSTRRLLCVLCIAAAAPAAAVAPGEPAPPIEAPSLLTGAPVRLADFRGQVVYLDFWASWCAPCAASLPWMEGLRREFGPSGFEVLAANVDADPADGRRFLRRHALTYPVLDDRHGSLAERYDVQAMPSSYLIDRRGVVRRVHRGFNSRDAIALREAVAALVAEPRP